MSIKRYGKVFNDWRIDKVIGRGGDGTVYRVEKDSYGIKDVSAVKAITICDHQGRREEMSEEYLSEIDAHIKEQLDKAIQEVTLMQKLRGNTNIVDFHDVTVIPWEEDEFFGNDLLIRMELLHNLSTERKKGKKFAEQEIIRLGKDICSALILCHSMNILHRDIKPDNIYWNDAGNYKLGDFGISKVLDTARSEKMTVGAGTKPYMAPEQAGESEYGNTADIYSLGLVMYELANENRLPFAEGILVTKRNIIDRLLGKPFPAPCKVSEPLAQVIMKACEFEAKNRYQTAQEFYDALNGLEHKAIQKPSVEAVPNKDIYATERADAAKVAPEQDVYATERAEITKAAPKEDSYATERADAAKAAPKEGNRAAEATMSPDELCDRGKAYEYGLGVERDLVKAVEYYRLAAEQGYARGQNLLGWCYDNGLGVDQNYQEAVKWYRLAAEQGNALAQNNLGFCYEYGAGVEQDYSEAVKWYRLSAEQGNASGQNNLGNCYRIGTGVVQDYSEAVKWHHLSAEQGNAVAQNNLGWCYYNGLGVEQNYNEAVKWYRMAVEQGDVSAQNNLGLAFYHGNGVEQDYNEAVKWFRLSAEQGGSAAQNNLGLAFYHGNGVEQDYNEAVKWFRLSAEQGFAMAQFNLGFCYDNGLGVMQDRQEALKWYRMAAEQGNENAIEALNS